MAYPTTITTYPTRIDKNASGYYVRHEYFNIPADPYQMYLDHVPQVAANTKIFASGGAEWTEDTTGSPGVNEFYVTYTTGLVEFNSADVGTAVDAQYYSLGDDIMAEHVNNVQTEVLNIETELGYSPSAGYANVGARLDAISGGSVVLASGINGDLITDDTIRAGALMDDIKGTTWQALAYPTIAGNKTDIDNHIADVTDAHDASAISVTSNAYGATTVQDHLSATGGGTVRSENPHGLNYMDIGGAIQSLTGTEVHASGNQMSTAWNGPDQNQYFYFYENSNASGVHIAWDDTYDKITMNEQLQIAGSFESGAITASGNILPLASGNYEVGTLAVSFGNGNFNEVQAVDYKTGASTGADGFFTTTDGKTVTVKSGLIVSIV